MSQIHVQQRRETTWQIPAFAALVVLLGLQSLRSFPTSLFWWLGETSDRIVMLTAALLAFSAAALAWPLIRKIGPGRLVLLSSLLLGCSRLIDQISSTAWAGLVFGGLGVIGFCWLASMLSGQGRQAGLGIALGLTADAAIRSAFNTIDIPFLNGINAEIEGIVATLCIVSALTVLACINLTRSNYLLPAIGQAWPNSAIMPGIFMFMLWIGNHGQIAQRTGVDWQILAICIPAALSAGAILTLLTNRWISQLLAPIGLSIGAGLFWLLDSFLGAVLSAMLIGPTLATLPASVIPEKTSVRAPVLYTTVGSMVFVVMLFIFYSFYAPLWIPLVLTGLVSLSALATIWRLSLSLHYSLQFRKVILLTALVVAAALASTLSTLATKSPSLTTTTAEPGQIRVMSYNIRQGFGVNSVWNLESVAREIEKHNPDIVALQEVGRAWIISGQNDQLQWLAQRLQMNHIYSPHIGDTWGNAILSRMSVASQYQGEFNSKGRIPRGYLDATLMSDSGPLRVIVTHLDHEVTSVGDSVRKDQMQMVLDRWEQSPATIIIGDMNFDPSSPGYKTAIAGGLKDVLLSEDRDGFTYRSDDLNIRIDYIFASSDLSVEAADLPLSQASDHLPLVADLSISN